MSADDCEVLSSFTMNVILVISFLLGFWIFRNNKSQERNIIYKENFEELNMIEEKDFSNDT